MIRYRPFLNCDPPGISEVWCAQPPQRGLMQLMTPAVLDQIVLAKPYFDRDGLIVAEHDGKTIGFAHAGFKAGADGSGLNFEQGATCLVMVTPGEHQIGVGQELLANCEEYLVQRGAKTLFGGGSDSMAAFYFGLYGGCRVSGVLQTDAMQTSIFRQAGYLERQRFRVLHRDLAGFRPVLNREIMQLRRQCHLQRAGDVLATNWWEASSLGQIDQVRFELAARHGDQRLGQVGFWDIEPLASSWGVHAMGMLQFEVSDNEQRATLATFLLGEAIRELQSFGVTLVEVHADDGDEELVSVCTNLGFQQVDIGIQFERPKSGS
ncbi:MAG: GNAT family N-acetyltransferase [Pirellulaceae bacterium]|jgi:GNAT superfamily N-acetyltransferase|nr:GNAT family N-acetyltransferase [Pirellulaceae bacterium]MDP6721289.1 GNAT family N-acetyltransferase [Pirellulaceae bacterium]